MVRSSSRGKSAEVVVKRGVLNQARWEQILQSAAVEFYEKGYKAARLQDIAARVGLLTGSLYYYIESKEQLLFFLVESTYRKRLEADTARQDGGGRDPVDRLREFIRAQVQVLEESPAASTLIVERDRKFLSAEHRAQIETLRAELSGKLEAILEDGIKAGDFDPTVDVGVATRTLFALVNTTPEWMQELPGQPWDEISDWYVRLFVSALNME